MATQSNSQSELKLVEACCVVEPEHPSSTTAQDPPSNNQGTGNESDYDFVEQPDQDCFCPVSLELLTEPYLTTCCGHHISKQAADRLIRERKPCPMCKEGDFTAHVDKYFKRKFINTLKVHCSHKKSGCEWVGELGDLNNHSTSCPKRPWKCQYCGLESTVDVGTNEHTPNCAQYPLPCPNQCEIGTIPRCDAEKHLLVCPLQPVECEFANVGCDLKVPRRDLTRHMTENAQHHLMSATLVNLQLIRELHQKMEEKDQQIAELKQQLNEQEVKMREESKKTIEQVDDKLQQQTVALSQMVEHHHTELSQKLLALKSKLLLEITYTCHEFTLVDFKKCQARGGRGSWYLDSFYSHPGGYKFQLNIDTNGDNAARDTHLSAFLKQLPGEFDKKIPWPVMIKIHLEMINQREDHNHHTSGGAVENKHPTTSQVYRYIGGSCNFFPLNDLAYNAQTNTEYLRNDSLKFRLWLKV